MRVWFLQIILHLMCVSASTMFLLHSDNVSTTRSKDVIDNNSKITHHHANKTSLSENYTKDLPRMLRSIQRPYKKTRYIITKTESDTISSKPMYVNEGEVSSLLSTPRVIELTITNGASIKNWGDCRYLKFFHLSHFDKEEFPKWPENCTRLEHLQLKTLLPEIVQNVADKMIAAASSLRNLEITYCRLYDLPYKLIDSAKNLVFLNLSKNELFDESFSHFPYLESLKSLDLSSNPIRGDGLGRLILKLPSLMELTLDEERDFYRVCSAETGLRGGFIDHLQNTSIEFIDFGSTAFHLNCFDGIQFRNLTHITMLFTATTELKPLDLPKTDAGHLEFDLGEHDFVGILFEEKDYETLLKENASYPHNGRNLTIWMGFVHCDCNVGWLAKALRDFPHIISMPNLRCNSLDGNHILQEPIESIECNKTGIDWCFYRQSWRDGNVIAECDKLVWMNMEFKFPVHGLNVSGTHVTSLSNKDLPNSIKWVDLRHNSISRGSAAQAAALFAAGRRVWLADNLLLCDCDNHELLDAIQQHRDQVPDYEVLKCVGTGDLISSISTDTLCQVALIASLSVAGVLIVVGGVIAVLLRRYSEQVRMFLYSKGLCVSCLQKLDPNDKPYDAFISFAHEDREWVMGRLVPGLERAPERFRVCVHYRDWLVGDWIPAQIMRSVQLSKRTLIVLSRNFVASAWSILELRYSLANAEANPNAKVIVLIKDDVLDMKLDVELRRYLTFNTYMICDDPWFWEKLRYAMPHKMKDNTTRNEDSDQRVRSDAMDMDVRNFGIELPDSNETVQEYQVSEATE